MSTARILLTAASCVVLVGPLSAQVAQSPPQAAVAELEPQDVNKTQKTSDFDDTVVVAGHRGVGHDLCGAGPQPFVEKTDPGGARIWLRTANADRDCDGDGQGDGEGDPLFAGMTSIDPAYIQAGSVLGLAFGASGEIYLTGQILIAWQSASPIGADSTWAAFVLRLAADGSHLGDAYLGVDPPAPPASVENCAALCATLAGTAFDQFAGRAVAYDATGVAVTGWWRAASAGGGSDQELFVARYTTDLLVRKFLAQRTYPGDDAGLGLAFDEQKHVLATGYFGVAHDVFAARFHGESGGLLDVFTGGGPWDDEGRQIASRPAEVEARGCFTDEATFGGQKLAGEGPTAFVLLLEPDLGFKSASAAGPCRNDEEESALRSLPLKARTAETGTPPPPPPPPVENEPKAMSFLIGTPGSCGCEQAPPNGMCVYQAGPGGASSHPCLRQVAESDDEYLHAYGEIVPGSVPTSEIEIEFDFEVDPQASVPVSVGLELNSDYCTTITLSLGGGDAAAGEYHELGSTELCPLDEPVITMPIPAAVAEALGFLNGNVPAAPVKCLLNLLLKGQACGGCAHGGQDADIDEAMLTSEYP